MRSVTITEHTLATLAARPELVKQIPALRLLVSDGKVKDCCARSSGRRQAMYQVRQRLLGLPVSQRAALRAALGADELVVYVAGPGSGRRVVL